MPVTLSLLTASEEQRIIGGGVRGQQTLKLASASARLAEEAEDRAKWTWLPTLELGAGMKHVSGAQRGYGYVVGLSLNLPLFDHGQALRAEAKAVSALSSARVSSLERGMDAELQSALASFRAARLELERFEEQTAGRVDTLLKAVRSGYLEGDRTIVELLDAQRAQTDVAERQITLLGDAKRAEARLRAAAGELK